MPQERCARLKELFAAGATEHGDDALGQWLQRVRERVTAAASTLQYDSAVLAAEQLGVEVPPEPFTERQRRQSRYDGGTEEDGRVRDLVPVTGPPKQGHVAREEAAAISGQRPLRDTYKAVPLTGAQQSMLPSYRLASRFMNFTELDEDGLVAEDLYIFLIIFKICFFILLYFLLIKIFNICYLDRG